MAYADAERRRERQRERQHARRITMTEADHERVRQYDREYQRSRYAADPERSRERSRAWRAANVEFKRERDRAYYAANRERAREYNRTTAHGITRLQRDALYASQGGCCGGCWEPFPDEQLQVDHDHECCPGKTSCGRCVRGLLCHGCNGRDVLAGERPARIAQDIQEGAG